MGDKEIALALFNSRTHVIKEFILEKVNILEMIMLDDSTMLLFYKKNNSDLLFANVRHLNCNNSIVERTLCSFESEKSKKILFEGDYIVVLSKVKSRYKLETIYGLNEQQHMPIDFISKYDRNKKIGFNFIECQGPDASGVGSYTLKKVLK